MASRFTGRDYATLRSEIIAFLRQRLPTDWDYTNLADPIVIFAESLARMGDQLHFTIDELRRECDIATANRASSVYSYAMREGYKMMLPRASFGTILLNALQYQSGKLHIAMKKFDPLEVASSGEMLYVANDNIDAILYEKPTSEYISNLRSTVDQATYVNTLASRTQRIKVVLGEYAEYNFTYSNINSDSTVDLPDPFIDRSLMRLTVTADGVSTEWTYVDDIIASGFVGNIFTLTPKFIGGAVSLCIEFPSNYQDLFNYNNATTFKFEYIKTKNKKVDPSEASTIDFSEYVTVLDAYADDDLVDPTGLSIDIGNGILGYTEYEDPSITKANYKHFVQDYSSLLTKDDYVNYIKAATTTSCKVFDHADMFSDGVLPPGTSLIERTIYILADALYNEREALFYDLRERSSRSDCIVLFPYGKDPYNIIIKAECFLLGTSVSTISTQIKSEILKYYGDPNNENIPTPSMISYLAHKASDKVIRLDACLVRDSTYGYTNSDFNNVSTMSNDDIDELYRIISTNDTSKTDLVKYTNSDVEGDYTLIAQLNDVYYRKYATVEYRQFPDEFPKIYNVTNWPDEIEVNNYSDVVDGLLVYGTFDTPAFDVSDTEIINRTITTDANDYDSVPPEDPVIDHTININNTLSINSEYLKHHYMRPTLNKVIIMIKAIDK